MTKSGNFNNNNIEGKWQEVWEKEKLYNPDIKNTDKEHKFYDGISQNSFNKNFYNLWMFPYPSAEGLHAGHAFASTGSDIYGRFMRMNGHTVFQPIGYDSFGIHSENYAIKIGEDPHEVVKRTTKHYEEQMRSLGHGYDWSRTVTTSDPAYYKWTQWLFLKMWEKGLAYKKKAEVNFCPSCKTVLADEQVMSPQQAGKEPRDKFGEPVSPDEQSPDLKVCERCGTIVEKRDLDQWFFKITDYADRLLSGLEKIDWSPRVKIAQKEWIGKKEGVKLDHKVDSLNITLTAFSAYPAWLFADTFLVVAPEHPVVLDLVKGTEYEDKVLKFVEIFKKNKTGKSKKLDEKEGIFTGRYVSDPFNKGALMPVWLANFALMDFGTGIIRCSAHDPRDYEFAQKYDIPLKEVVERTQKDLPVNAHTNEGKLIDSGPFTGRNINPELIQDILDWIEKEGIGERNTNYHLRDWLVSRQRYWGAPIPMIHCAKCGWQPVPEAELPVLLPEIKDYKPEGTGKGPLANHKEFYETICPNCGGSATRETDVMDTFVDSSWYFLRYPSVNENSKFQISNSKSDPNLKINKLKNSLKISEAWPTSLVENSKIENLPWNPSISKAWLPVDLYFGGAEHSVLHLMYARFVWMVLRDMNYIGPSSEAQPRSTWEEPFPRFFAHGLMIKDGAKMSKSRGNVVNPDEYVAKYGADTLRLYLMFMGPMDGYPDFRDSGIEGMQRFLGRFLKLFEHKIKPSKEDLMEVCFKTHKTIKKVTEDIKEFKYNTSIASMMELINLMSLKGTDNRMLKALTKLMAPFAPHITEELWHTHFKENGSIHVSVWPKWNEKYLSEGEVTIVIQVNGKFRGQLSVESSKSEDKEYVLKLAKVDDKVGKWLKGLEIKKEIFIPGKLVNFVV